MATATKRVGRKKGGRKQGFYFRKGRGFCVVENGSSRLLLDVDEQPIRDNTPDGRSRAKAAFKAYEQRRAEEAPQTVLTGDSSPVAEIISAYLEHAKRSGAKSTHTSRANNLFDFCTGYPGSYRKRAEAGEKLNPKERIHEPLGQMPVKALTKHHVLQWTSGHKDWAESGASRMAIQGLKRAMNWAVEMGLISRNPIRGYKVKQAKKRLTYFTPEQEQAMLERSHPAFALALKVCIRIGCRYGCEFAALEARHVHETDKGMVLKFAPAEAKSRKKERRILVPKDIADIVRQLLAKHDGKGRVFRNADGGAWTMPALKKQFQRMKSEKLKKAGIELDADSCMYTCRHTFAKRTLGGFWTGQPKTIEQLAGLMGNTRQVASETYGQWCDSYQQPLWDALEG